ncbi:MAG: hypothetical protein QM541_10310 [Flavobacterium sp.]|nr:hypothetical protein [Flavobacterium sp.]
MRKMHLKVSFAKMQQQQATSALQLASRIQAISPTVAHADRHSAFVNSLVVNALALLADNGEAAQAALKADVTMLETLMGAI